MNAEDARKLSERARAPEPDERKVVILVQLWENAIRKATARGARSVHESQVDRLRSPASPASRRAALDRLRAKGFSVVEEQPLGNVVGAEVSW